MNKGTTPWPEQTINCQNKRVKQLMHIKVNSTVKNIGQTRARTLSWSAHIRPVPTLQLNQTRRRHLRTSSLDCEPCSALRSRKHCTYGVACIQMNLLRATKRIIYLLGDTYTCLACPTPFQSAGSHTCNQVLRPRIGVDQFILPHI